MTTASDTQTPAQLVDGFGRQINYVRLSVTDRCDLRCRYCMAEDMTFLPRKDLLSIEELSQLGESFTDLGVTKIRVTGGEPLIRRGIIPLMERLGSLPGLKELCMTTNATRMQEFAQSLKDAGVDRLNISLDSLDPERFRYLTRHGDLDKVFAGIRAAQRAGFKRIKLNCVALKNYNADEVPDLVRFALDEGLDISFIEEMPLGQVNDHGRAAEFVSSEELRRNIERTLPLQPSLVDSGGPSRYWYRPGYDSRIGFISPHSNNFCASCNRVRVTATGRLLLCLGQENSVDLRSVMREHPLDQEPVMNAIRAAMAHKPKSHDFEVSDDEPQIVRFMNTTGG